MGESRKTMRRFVLCVSFFIILLGSGIPNYFAQTTGEPSKGQAVKAEDVKPSGYPVVLGDQTLYYVRDIKDISGRQYSGQTRANTISERIKVAAENPDIRVGSITISPFERPQTLILIGNELLSSVLDEDVLKKGQTREQLATEYSQRIGDAIEKYRQGRSLKRRLMGILYTLIATLVLIAALYLINKLYHKGETRIKAWLDSKKVHIGIQTFEVVRAERVRVFLMGGLRVIRVFILLLLFYAYLHLSLSFFPWTKAFASQLFGHILGPLKAIGTAVVAQIPNLLFLAIIVLITIYVLKLMRLLFKGMEDGTITFKGFYPEWAQPTYRILRTLVIAFAVVMAFPYIPGSESSAFKGVSIFFGVLFSLGSTSAIANIIAGYTLTYRRVFKIGDRVKIADFVGDVITTRLQVTHLRTIKNEEIVVPNSMIVSSHVINYSSMAHEEGLILHTTVTIGYDAPWRQVHSLLLMAAERTSGLLREPPPFILQKSLDDFYVTYELNVYTDKPLEMAKIYSELHQNIQDAFNEHGVQIMSPHYEMDPGQMKVVPKERWYAPPAIPPDGSKGNG
jgi:small-conductance mechanosensitive channel